MKSGLGKKTRYLVGLIIPVLVIATVLLFPFVPYFANEALAVDTSPYVGFFSPPTTWYAAGNVNPAVPYPDPRSGDLLVAAIAVRPSTITYTTPSGWTSLGAWTGTDGAAENVDTGSVKIEFWYKVADGTEGLGTQSFTKSGTVSVQIARMFKLRSATGTYDVTAGGYSINGDATDWSGTLDTDIGLTAEDVTLTFGATNGDLSAHSAQAVAATSVSSWSTFREHLEAGSTTGNDIEATITTGQVWSGTNSATPTVTYTQSVASSGAVAVVRVRQGAGTNRTDTWVRSAGAQVAGTTSVAVPYPEHSIGDRIILLIGSRYATTPTTPTNWTLIDNGVNGGAGTNTTDSGVARISAYYRDVTARLSGTQSVTHTSGNATIGQMLVVHKDEVTDWSYDHDGGVDSTVGTGWSVSGSGLDFRDDFGGDVLLVGSAINTDAYTYTGHAFSATGITFGEVTQASFFGTTNGGDMLLEAVLGRVSSGSGTGVVPTYTSTASSSSATAPAGVSLFLTMLGLKPAFDQSAYRFFANDNSTNVGSAIAPQDTTAALSTDGEAFRLRMLVNVSDALLPQNGETFKLQFAEKSGTCDSSFTGETYADVTTGTAIAFSGNATPADGDNLTSNAGDPTNGGNTIVNQDYEEANNFTNSVALVDVGQDGKWDFSLIDNTAPDGTSYCFRVVLSDNTALDSYSVIPEVTTASSTSQSITFSLSDNTIGFGEINSSATRYASGDLNGSGSETVAHTFDVTTNATGGYTVLVQGDTLENGSYDINSCGPSCTLSAGSEQFGLRITASGGTGTVSSPYNHASNYAYEASSSTLDEIATAATGDGDVTTYSVRYGVNVSPTTASGTYSGTYTYTVVPSF